ncbi:TIGR02680 family protein [Anaerobacillus alkalidiazotrophicus]|uniref:TIGR02680 family protein n=1 Tax=Anaerobacillus alkalidiazotrophicus TaxID=472963 RepID=A0A1S2LXW3_9BACI|nr:TIGR02680 family protein [Anaerobacillus alkalidiazotrophicus]OIJ16517.1 TIGR02680 family protein [Anaerobacillus alkalidiazotrophicus]
MIKRENPFLPAAVGYINFWVYTQEEYEFHKGNLLFGGENGQGKSVSMQSIIPLLLDGNKHPTRIDPFQTNKKKIIDYMKENEEIIHGKIAYLYLVYEKEVTKDIVTTGLGLRSKSDGKVELWGFVIEGERPGKPHESFSLVESDGFDENGIEMFKPINKQRLRDSLKKFPRATFANSQTEYAEAVNNAVFKFEGGATRLKELTDLLIQVRSPKLSKEMKPNILYDALKWSLPEISNERVTRISNTIKDIDDRNRKIDDTEKDLELATALSEEYDRYLEVTLQHASSRLLEASKDKDKTDRQLKQTEDDMHNKRALEIRTNDEKTDMEIELVAQNKKIDNLETPELRNLNNQLDTEKSEKVSKEMKLKGKKDDLEVNETRMRSIKQEISKFEDRCYEVERSINNQIRDLEDTGEEIQFHENASYLTSAKENLNNYRMDNDYFNSWSNRLSIHIKQLKNLVKLFEEEDNAKEKVDRQKEKMRELDLDVSDATKEYNKAVQRVEKEKEAFKRSFSSWIQECELFAIPQQVIGFLMNVVENLFELNDMTPQVVEKELLKVKEVLTKPVSEQFSINRAEIINKKDEVNKISVELEELQKIKAVEPWSRRKETKEQRKHLQQLGIPFVPFYEAVDFKGGVTEEIKERIESALLDMGLLDALIIPEMYRDKVDKNDSIIIPKKDVSKGTTLSYYLRAVPPKEGISTDDIEDVLRSISMEDTKTETVILTNGRYKSGLLHGYAIEQPRASFIGEEARRRHREETIHQTELQLEKMKEELDHLEMKESKIKDQIAQIDEEYDKRPILDLVEVASNELKENKFIMEKVIIDQEKAKNLHQQLIGDFNQKRNERILGSKFLDGDVTKETVSYMFDIADDEFRSKISVLSNAFNSFSTSKIELENAQEKLQQSEATDEELRDDIATLERAVKQSTLVIKNITEQLNELDYSAVKKKIVHTRERIKQLKEEIPKKLELYLNLKNQREQLESRIENIKRVLAYKTRVLSARKEVLEREMHERGIDKNVVILEFAKKQAGEAEINIAKVIEDMMNAVHHSRSNGLENNTIQSFRVSYGNITLGEEDYGEDKDKYNSTMLLYSERERLNVTLSIDGLKKNPSEFREYLREQLELQKQFLRKDEESLIRDLIIQGTGEEIHQLIKKAKKWKDDINQIMEDMKNSISLRLVWEPIAKSDHQSSLSTVRLIELLGRDFGTLKDKDIEDLRNHFMTKINEAKDKLVSGSDAENLEQALKQVLDYREWYQFKIMYTLEGEKEKTLNEDNLSKLSGGEKAMAIYIPLFSATYSKYSNAGDDAPYILALDEAYAGVDDNNISEMFGIMQQYQFNYILTSQALWADYETVPGINIYVLNFDKTRRVVSSEPWRWDGKKIEMNERMLKKRGIIVGESGEMEFEKGIQTTLDFDFVETKDLKV